MPFEVQKAAAKIREIAAASFYGSDINIGGDVEGNLTFVDSSTRFGILFQLLHLAVQETGHAAITTYMQACTMFVNQIELEIPRASSATRIVFHDGSSLSLAEADKYMFYEPIEGFKPDLAAEYFPEERITIFPALKAA